MAYRIPPPGQPISLFDVQSEFGGEVPIAIDEYYGVDDGVPVSGTISLGDFYGTSGRFVWCDGDMSNVVVGIADEIPGISILGKMAYHGDNTLLTTLTGSNAKLVVTVVNDDGTISSFVSVHTFVATRYHFAGLNSTEGYMYDDVSNEVVHYTIDTSTEDLIVFDGTPIVVPEPADEKCMGIEIVYEHQDGVQFVVWTFGDSADVFDVKAYSIKNDVLTYGTTHHIDGDTHDPYYYAQARQDSFFLAYGQQNARLFYISPTTNEITQVMEHLTADQDTFITKTYGQISGKSHIVVVTKMSLENNLEVTNVSEDGTTSVVYIPTTLIYENHDGMCLTGNCLVVSGYDPANTKKKKLLKTTVYEDSMDEFVTLYLQQDESPVDVHYQFRDKTGIHTNGNKWLFFTEDVASGDTRLSSLTVDPYIIPDPPSGLPTLILTDTGRGEEVEDSLQTFDVSSASSGTMTYLASLNLADIGGVRAVTVATDPDNKIAFISVKSDGSGSSMIYALDMSDPANSSGWVIGSVDAAPGKSLAFTHIYFDKTNSRIFLSTSGDHWFYCCDVSDPTNMVVLGGINTSGGDIATPLCMDEQNQILFFGATEDLIAMDVSDPANMTELAKYTHATLTPFDEGLVIDSDRNLIFVGGSYDGFGYVDVSDLATMEFVVLLPREECMSRTLVYDQSLQVTIADTDYDSSGGLKVHRIDVSDLGNVTLESFECAREPGGLAIDTGEKIVYVTYPDANKEFIALDYSAGITQIANLETTMECEYAALSS